MSNYRILAVDDEEHILELIEYNLMQNGFSVIKAMSGEEALQILKEQTVDLVLLDIMMEDMDGLEVLKRIRTSKQHSHLPVIFLTAKGEEIDKVVGLEIGADDYMAKPFGVRELIARIKAVLRRSVRSHEQTKELKDREDEIQIEQLTINKVTREVLVNGQVVDFALKEFELLYLLVKEMGVCFSREQILEKVWGYDYFGETRTVDVHIRNIRRKLEDKGLDGDCIRTVRGVGYKFQLREQE